MNNILILTETENTPILELFPKITNKKLKIKSNSEFKNNKDLKNIKNDINLKLILNDIVKIENKKFNHSPSKKSLNENVNNNKKSLSFFYKNKNEFINYDKFNFKSSNKTVRKNCNKELNNNIDILTLKIKNNRVNSNAMNDLLNKLIKVKKKINEIIVKKKDKVNQIKLNKHKNNNSNSNINLNDFAQQLISDNKNNISNDNEKEKTEEKTNKKEISSKTRDKNNFNKKNKLELKLSFDENISNNSNNNKIKAFSVRKKSNTNSKSNLDKYDRYKFYNNYSQNIVTEHIKYIDKIRDTEFINLFQRFQKSLLKNKIEEINHMRSLVFPKKLVDKIIKMKNELTIDKYRNEYLNKIETYKYNSKKILNTIRYHNNFSINDEDTYDNVKIRLKKRRNNFNKTYENRFDKNSIKRKLIKNLNNNISNANNYNSEFILDLNCN